MLGNKQILKELDELYFRYSGFASVEVGEKSYDRIHVNGFLRLYQTDIKELRRGIPVGCNSALVNGFMAINGSYPEDLLEKFIVFDDEVVIGVGTEITCEDDLVYPNSIYYRESDLLTLCERFGLVPNEVDSELITDSSLDSIIPDREVDLLKMVGGLSCLLAKQKGVDHSQAWYDLSDAFIDELFQVMEKLGVSVEGKNKFRFERLIFEGLKMVLPRGGNG
jgi:hypothetical protein